MSEQLETLSLEEVQARLAARVPLERSFRDLDLRGCDLRHVSMRGALFENVVLSRLNLAGANLTDAVFQRCVLSDARMEGLALQRAAFIDCEAKGVELTRCDLQDCALLTSDFSGSRFTVPTWIGRVSFDATSAGRKWMECA